MYRDRHNIYVYLCIVLSTRFFDYLQKYETLRGPGADAPKDSSDEVSLLHTRPSSLASVPFSLL